MHGLTDQVFALALVRLPQLEQHQRQGWFTSAMLVAWFSWIGGTALGAIAGEELTRRWPLLAEVMPFALPALFLLLIIPKFVSRPWVISLSTTVIIALVLKLSGLINAAIPLAAGCGMLLYYAVDYREKHRG